MKKEKMNDKGFSLVELIIVIAIMAVLVVVLAPQYLKYVERSRNSTDMQNATTAVTALQVYAADPEAKETFQKGKFTITVKTGDDAVIGGTTENVAAAKDALGEAKISLTELKCKSKTTWASYQIEGDVKEGGNIEFTYHSYTSKDGTGTDNSALSDKMAGNSTTTE